MTPINGCVTTLVSAITSSQTTGIQIAYIPPDVLSNLPASFSVIFSARDFATATGVTGSGAGPFTLTGVTRGTEGVTSVSHASGEDVGIAALTAAGINGAFLSLLGGTLTGDTHVNNAAIWFGNANVYGTVGSSNVHCGGTFSFDGVNSYNYGASSTNPAYGLNFTGNGTVIAVGTFNSAGIGIYAGGYELNWANNVLNIGSGGSVAIGNINTATTAGTIAGQVCWDSVHSHFYGWNGSAWKQLDN